MMILSPIFAKKKMAETGLPLDSNFYITKDFSWQEILVNQKEIPSLGVLENLLSIAKVLQVYRDKVFKCPIKITSGYRSENYNSKIPGANPKSLHCLGLAIDFLPYNCTASQGYSKLDLIHKGGLERTNGDWIHIDNRNSVVRFDNKGIILASHFDIKAHDKLFKEA